MGNSIWDNRKQQKKYTHKDCKHYANPELPSCMCPIQLTVVPATGTVCHIGKLRTQGVRNEGT